MHWYPPAQHAWQFSRSLVLCPTEQTQKPVATCTALRSRVPTLTSVMRCICHIACTEAAPGTSSRAGRVEETGTWSCSNNHTSAGPGQPPQHPSRRTHTHTPLPLRTCKHAHAHAHAHLVCVRMVLVFDHALKPTMCLYILADAPHRLWRRSGWCQACLQQRLRVV